MNGFARWTTLVTALCVVALPGAGRAEEEKIARQKAREAQKVKQMIDELTYGKNLGDSEKSELVKIELAHRGK